MRRSLLFLLREMLGRYREAGELNYFAAIFSRKTECAVCNLGLR